MKHPRLMTWAAFLPHVAMGLLMVLVGLGLACCGAMALLACCGAMVLLEALDDL